MERGIYFDGWFPNEHCYHPSMPPRRLAMLDDLADMRGTILVWAGLGGGTISLPYLEEEAHGSVPARFRQHGFVTDAEFIAAAKERGIDLFAIVFEAQAWEFPARYGADGEVLAQNQLLGEHDGRTVGLREFSSDTGPASWKPFRHYFPDGLTNSDGEQVSDLWSEIASRDLEGNPLHAHWVEVPGIGQQCYLADRVNPVWREYLKAIIRIQIDAGAPGIQLDESDLPLLSMRYGGCFCKDCMKGFRRHLQALPEAPPELAGVDLATFDYRTWLLDQGFRAGTAPQLLPMADHYIQFLMDATVETFAEVARYVRQYAAETGRDVRLAGNFYDCAPIFDAMVEEVDVCVTEMRETRYQQPWWFRHAVSVARGRPLIAVENPYGGVTEDLSERLKLGRGRDLFRMTIYEAAAMGGNMSLPYGSWLGSVTKDSFWAPRQLCVEVGDFLASVDALTSARSAHRTAVLCPVASIQRTAVDADQFFDAGAWYERPDATGPEASYWPVIEHLSRNGGLFDVVVLADTRYRENDLTVAGLSRYDVVVVPDAWRVSPDQHAVLCAYADAGGRVVVHGGYGDDLEDADRLLGHERVRRTSSTDEVRALVGDDVTGLDAGLAACVHALDDGSRAVHLLNYDYDEESDTTRGRHDLELTHGFGAATATLHRPGHEPEPLAVTAGDGTSTVVLPELDLYAVVHLTAAG